MTMLIWMLACEEKTDTADSAIEETALVCVDWVDSCGGCTWMCTDESLEPDVVCDVECTEPRPEGECSLTDENTCSFQ